MKATISQALILAAGRGSRLGGKPKPLHRLLGIPLLARTILTLKQAGISDFYIVIGFEGDKIRKGIEKFFKGKGPNITWLENDKWELPNGHSVLCGDGVIEGNFIMTMSDHLFTSDIVKRLENNFNEKGGDLHLAVDLEPKEYHDIDDATKVRVADGKIEDIGKQISNYTAYDTGVFLVTPALFEALRNCGKEKVELSDGVRALSAKGQAYVADIGDNLWYDIDLPSEFKMARKLLLRSLVKPTDGIIAKHFNRPVSLFCTRLLAPTPITPNVVTVLTFLLALYGAYAVTKATYWSFLIGAIIFQVTSILDGCDGELSRVKFQSSQFGAWMDTVFDNLSYILSLLGLTIGCYLSPDIPAIFHQLGIGAFVFVLGIFPMFYLYLKRNKRKASMLDVDYGLEQMSPVGRKIFETLYLFGKRDLFAVIFLFMGIFGVFEYVIVYCCILIVGLLCNIIRAYAVAALKQKKKV